MRRLLVILTALAVAALSSGAQSRRPRGGTSAGLWSISGVVLSATTGAPLDQAEVTLATVTSGSQLARAVTGENGTFRFGGIPAGKYMLDASRRGYVASAFEEHEGGYSTAIVTGPGLDSENIHFALLPAGIISGTVTDDSGDPVRSAQVTLYRWEHLDGKAKVVTAGSDQTDDTGGYEFARLRPGTYYISVAGVPWYAFHPPPKTDASGNPLPEEQQVQSPLDVAYPLTFFANATDSGSATPIRLRSGEHVEANIPLHAVPAVHLRISLPLPSGSGRGITMPQLSQDVFGADQSVGFTQGMTRSVDHRIVAEITGLAPGQYSMIQSGPEGGANHRSSIDLTGDQHLDVSEAVDAVEVAGKVAMASGSALPSHTSILLRPANGEGSAIGGEVAATGAFDLPSVSSGTYDVVLNAPGSALSVLQMAASGGQTQGRQLIVGNQPVLLAATLASGSVTVHGYAKQSGRGLGGVMILLVPHELGASRELFRRDQSDSDGSFALNQVVPGIYTLVALENGWGLDWSRPEVLAPYLARGIRLQIGNGEKTIELAQPLEVQPW